jgi:hypothetical protein
VAAIAALEWTAALTRHLSGRTGLGEDDVDRDASTADWGLFRAPRRARVARLGDARPE